MKMRATLLALFVGAGMVVLAFLLIAPPDRAVADFRPPASVELSPVRALRLEETIKAEERTAGPNWYRYRVRDRDQGAADFRLEVIAFRSANSEARTLPALVVLPNAPPRQAPDIPVTLHGDDPRRPWLEFKRDGESFRGARISPEGWYTVTKGELWRNRLAAWGAHPMHLVKWLFTSESIVDRRAIWVEMRTTDHAAPVAKAETIDAVWAQVLEAFSSQAREGFAGR